MIQENNEPGTSLLFHLIISALAVFFLIISFSFFISKYGIIAGKANFTGNTFGKDFYLTFYIFFFGAGITMLLFLFSTNFISGLLLFFLAVSSMVLVDYSLTDYLTVKIWMYAAFLVIFAVRFEWPLSLVVNTLLSVLFTLFQRLPSFMGENLLNANQGTITIWEQISFFIILCFFGACISIIQMLRRKLHKVNQQAECLNGTITKLSEFNQSLQSFARTAEETATKKERFRISREIHDISGYIFTNIIALMDAIIITGCKDPEKTSDICLTTRGQAQEGLQETRRALRSLRNLDSDKEKGLRAIYKIKKIFEETTGVSVQIESGNLPCSFGDKIDLIIYRTVQESLTNALRHGYATQVHIDFWIIDNTLNLTILDNGIGAKKLIKGIGLAGMEERISQIHGEVQAMNAPEGGFKLAITIPLPEGQTNDQDSAGR
jgi:signal transduction histidine kinase